MEKDRYATSSMNFTYYLGAGASAEALPVISNLSERFLEVAQELELANTIQDEYIFLKESHIQNLKEMATESSRFRTIDTFLKFLYLRNRNNFSDILITLEFFFLYEQIIKGKIDNRALAFLTTVMQYDQIFPTNIKIISWNYDFQIELAANSFRAEEISYDNSGSQRIHKPPVVDYYPSTTIFPLEEDIKIIHLNGIAGLSSFQNRRNYNHFLYSTNDINEIFKISHELKNKSYTTMSFAWEYEGVNFSEKRFELGKKIMSETDIVIVIGYSFPFFNRNVDKIMFESFLKNGRAKKIYFQDKYLDGKFLASQFEIDEKMINPISDVKNYFVPKEL